MSNVNPPVKTAVSVETVLQKKSVRAALPVDQCLRLLRELANFDISNEAQTSKWKWISIALGVAVVASLVLAVASSPAGLVLLMILIVPLVYSAYQYSTLADRDLSNGFRELLLPLLETIRDDFRPARPIRLQVDFRGVVAEKVTHRETISKPRNQPRTNSIKLTCYTDPWCRLDAQLSGGQRLRLAVVDHYVMSVRSYRSTSGKYKSKTKWKKKTIIRAVLAAKDARPIDPKHAQVPPEIGTLRVLTRGGRSVLVLTRKFKSKQDKGCNPPVKPVVMMLVALCAALGPEGKTSHVAG